MKGIIYCIIYRQFFPDVFNILQATFARVWSTLISILNIVLPGDVEN